MAWPPVPAMRSRAEHFDALVLDCADRVRPHLGTRYAAPEFAVEEVPPQDPALREVVTEQVAALLGVPPHEIDPDRDPDA